MAYRHGHQFDDENFLWIGDYTEDEISQAQIVKRAAVQSVIIENRKQLYLKIATENANGALTKN